MKKENRKLLKEMKVLLDKGFERSQKLWLKHSIERLEKVLADKEEEE